jgi:hypothetical protein
MMAAKPDRKKMAPIATILRRWASGCDGWSSISRLATVMGLSCSRSTARHHSGGAACLVAEIAQ